MISRMEFSIPLIKMLDNTKVDQVADTTEERSWIQNDFDKVEKFFEIK